MNEIVLDKTMLKDTEILRYLGYRGQFLDEMFRRQLEHCKETVCRAAQPRSLVRRFEAFKGNERTDIALLLAGQDIRRHLEDCQSIYLMACTLGHEVEKLLMRTQLKNMADALVMDACASTAIEVVCNLVEASLCQEGKKNGEFLTGRFSPGYGDFSIMLQAEFISILDAGRQIGLTVNESGLLLPRKSVTAVIGGTYIAEMHPNRGHKKYTCSECKLYENCLFHKGGNDS